jgi:hypothetical protein
VRELPSSTAPQRLLVRKNFAVAVFILSSYLSSEIVFLIGGVVMKYSPPKALT